MGSANSWHMRASMQRVVRKCTVCACMRVYRHTQMGLMILHAHSVVVLCHQSLLADTFVCLLRWRFAMFRNIVSTQAFAHASPLHEGALLHGSSRRRRFC